MHTQPGQTIASIAQVNFPNTTTIITGKCEDGLLFLVE
jgi:hypothetical protein